MGKREDILAATLDLVVEGGIQSLSLSKIFARAGVGSGTVYNYFESKEALVNTLYRELLASFNREVLAGYDPTGSLKERFRTLLGNFASFTLVHPKERAFLDACGHLPSIAPELRMGSTPSMEAARALFTEGQRTGAFVEMDPMMMVAMLNSAITAVVQGGIDGKYRFDEAALEQALEACWRAVARPARGAARDRAGTLRGP